MYLYTNKNNMGEITVASCIKIYYKTRAVRLCDIDSRMDKFITGFE